METTPMDIDLVSSFKTSLVEYCNAQGLNIASNSIKINQNSDSFYIHCGLLDENIKNNLLKMKHQNWRLPVDDVKLNNHKLFVKLNRKSVFDSVFNVVFLQNSTSGICYLNKYETINLSCEELNSSIDLTNYRTKLMFDVVQNLCSWLGFHITESDATAYSLRFSNKSNLPSLPSNSRVVHCGSVLNKNHNIKETTISIDQYKNLKREILLRETEDRGLTQKDIITLLADAIVKFEFLRIKSSSPVILDFINDNSSGSAVFVLYNYSRLNAIIHEFEARVANNFYPPLPSAKNVDFSLLKEDKEWTLLFHFVMHFPTVIKNCILHLREGKPSVHLLCTFIYALARTISSYYRSTKILLDNKPQLLPLIFARLYLVKAVHQVLRKGLELLCIKVIPAL